MTGNKIQTLSIGLSDSTKSFLGDVFSKVENIEVDYDIDKLMDLTEIMPALILCGIPNESFSLTEAAQMLRMQYQGVAMYLIVPSTYRVDRKTIIKNGFTDVFFVPLDNHLLVEKVSDLILRLTNSEMTFRNVKLMDLSSTSVLEFDTYIHLPSNNKHIRYTAAGQPIDETRLNRLKTKQVATVFVAEADMSKFYEYVARNLKEMGQQAGTSLTQRQEMLKGAVREIITGLFSDTMTSTDNGKRVVEDCQNIVRSYITSNSGSGTSFYERIVSIAGDGTNIYSHGTNVATFASLFAIGVGLKTIEEIALAGILHDIGLTQIPATISEKLPDARTPEEKTIYEQHPEHSIAIIQGRKLVVPDLVYKVILQHHERFDGKGYPKKLDGKRICVEAQILAFADHFDELTSLSAGKPGISPAAAIAQMRAGLSNPSIAMIDPVLMRQLLGLFPKSQAQSSPAA